MLFEWAICTGPALCSYSGACAGRAAARLPEHLYCGGADGFGTSRPQLSRSSRRDAVANGGPSVRWRGSRSLSPATARAMAAVSVIALRPLPSPCLVGWRSALGVVRHLCADTLLISPDGDRRAEAAPRSSQQDRAGLLGAGSRSALGEVRRLVELTLFSALRPIGAVAQPGPLWSWESGGPGRNGTLLRSGALLDRLAASSPSRSPHPAAGRAVGGVSAPRSGTYSARPAVAARLST